MTDVDLAFLFFGNSVIRYSCFVIFLISIR